MGLTQQGSHRRNIKLAYDPAGNVVERTSSSSTETFVYDALDCLVGQDATGRNEASWSYAYDPNHNRQARNNADQRNELYSYRQGTNRLSTIDRFVVQPGPDSPASVQFDVSGQTRPLLTDVIDI